MLKSQKILIKQQYFETCLRTARWEELWNFKTDKEMSVNYISENDKIVKDKCEVLWNRSRKKHPFETETLNAFYAILLQRHLKL